MLQKGGSLNLDKIQQAANWTRLEWLGRRWEFGQFDSLREFQFGVVCLAQPAKALLCPSTESRVCRWLNIKVIDIPFALVELICSASRRAEFWPASFGVACNQPS